MTHDEMIEAVAKAIGQRIEGAAEDMDSDWYGRPLWQAYVEEARAAIRVIAPAVLEEAARIAPAKIRAEGCETVGQWERRALREAIRAMKTRYEQ